MVEAGAECRRTPPVAPARFPGAPSSTKGPRTFCYPGNVAGLFRLLSIDLFPGFTEKLEHRSLIKVRVGLREVHVPGMLEDDEFAV